MEIDSVRETQEEWIQVEGTQKRKMANPRGRPRLFQRIDTSQGDIQSFLQLITTQNDATTIPETQESNVIII